MEDDYSFLKGKASLASFSWAWRSSAPACFEVLWIFHPGQVLLNKPGRV
jgi:hypothetical protein